jgi:hypothetical protein
MLESARMLLITSRKNTQTSPQLDVIRTIIGLLPVMSMIFVAMARLSEQNSSNRSFVPHKNEQTGENRF